MYDKIYGNKAHNKIIIFSYFLFKYVVDTY